MEPCDSSGASRCGSCGAEMRNGARGTRARHVSLLRAVRDLPVLRLAAWPPPFRDVLVDRYLGTAEPFVWPVMK